MKPMLKKAQKHKPDLLTAWMVSFFMFFAAMILAPFARSTRFATALVTICGV
jgi:solute carrier family 45 protein 1/2/4